MSDVNLGRRGFLKIGAAAATAIVAASRVPGLVLFDEPVIAHPYKDWVTDKGDYYEVVIPGGRSFARERFDKSVLLLMGERSIFTDCDVRGFVNVYAMSGFKLSNSRFDASGLVSTVGARSPLCLNKGERGTIYGCDFIGPSNELLRLPHGTFYVREANFLGANLREFESPVERALALGYAFQKVSGGFKWRRT